ncbi:hypothetical protein Tco_0649803, partial [Tanacetum coccineum]
MSQPANDVLSQHLSDDEASFHEDASDNEREVPASFANEVIYSLFVKQSEDLDLLHEDLDQ